MSLPIIWAPGTRQQYADLLKFIENEFGLEAALKFLETESTKCKISNGMKKKTE